REEPTPDLARSAVVGLRRTLSPNDRLQRFFHPWSSYVVVPLFALANAGIEIDGFFVDRAMSSPITLGIVLGYVVGKPLAVISASTSIRRGTTCVVRRTRRSPWSSTATSNAPTAAGPSQRCAPSSVMPT